MRPRGFDRGGIALVMAMAATLSAARGDEPKGTRWVGPEALLYAESARPEALLDRYMSDRVNKLLQTVPSYKAAMVKPEIVGAQFMAGIMAANLGTTPEKGVRDLAGGGIVFAVEGTKTPDRVFLVVTPKDSALLEQTHARVLEFVRNDAKGKKKPDPVTVADYKGIKTYSLAPGEAHAIVAGALVVANGPATLKILIDRSLDAKTPALADDPTFQARRKEADPEALAWGFARMDKLRAIDPKKYGGEKADAGATFLFGPWLEAIQKGDTVSASLVWTDSRLAAQMVLAEPKGGYTPAMKRYFPPKGTAAKKPIRTPSTIASSTLWRDFSSIWEVRAEILSPETVQGLAQLDSTAGTFFGGRDFGTGVLGAIGEHWSFVVADQDYDKLDPSPDVKLPAFAFVIELKPDDEDFATRLMAAFQSFIGLANLGAAQTKAPPLMISSDVFDGTTIATSKYEREIGRPKGEPINGRHNFTPSAARVGNYFILSSSLGLARELVTEVKKPATVADAMFVTEADGPAAARLVDRNRSYLVTQNMLSKGNAKAQAEGEIGLMVEALKYLGHASMSVTERPGSLLLKIEYALDYK
jgi:hypothetical protein